MKVGVCMPDVRLVRHVNQSYKEARSMFSILLGQRTA